MGYGIMVRIDNQMLDGQALLNQYKKDGTEWVTLSKMLASQETYKYSSLDALKFDLNLRKEIVAAARRLDSSQFSFEPFKDSRCNTLYWKRTASGGFFLKPGVSAYAAIKDILENSQLYATECATAIVIVFYLAIVNIFPEKLFNKLFNAIYLMDWRYLDKDLGVKSIDEVPDYFPGDCRYFANPDFDPKSPEWRGENTILLENGYYYGHGIGIKSDREIIRILNQLRKPDSTTSAHLIGLVVRPGYKYLFQVYRDYMQNN